jgi:hypothetical protein
MAEKISGNDIRARQDYGVANHYLSLSVAVVSLGLAAAAAAVASLIAQFPSLGPNRLLLCLLWLGGVLAIVVGYGGPMVGAFALPPSIPLIQDLIPPLILGISEFLVFAVFINKFTPTTDISTTLVTWFVANGIYGLTAFAVVLRARFLYKQSRGKYAFDVLPALDSYIAYMTFSLFGPAMLVTFAIGGALSWWAWHAQWLAITWLSLILVNFTLGLWFHNVQARPWQAILAKQHEREPPRIIRRPIKRIREHLRQLRTSPS